MSDPVRRARELTRRHLDGLLTETERAELEHLLVSQPEAARVFVELTRLEANLEGLFRESEATQQETTRLLAMERKRRRRWLAPLVAAILLLSVGAGLWQFLTVPSGEHHVVAGRVLVAGQRVVTVPLGVELLVAGTEPATIQFQDGSRAEFEPQSLAVLHQAGKANRLAVELREGGGTFEVEKGAIPFQVDTPQGSVRVLGTKFTVQLIAEEGDGAMNLKQLVLAVAVMSGIVQVEMQGQFYTLTGGQSRAFGEDERGVRVRVLDTVGVVKTLDGMKLTLTNERDAAIEKTFELGADTKVMVDGKAAKASDLKAGLRVVVRQEGDKVTPIYVHAEGRTVYAVLKSAAGDGSTITLPPEDRSSDDRVLPLVSDVKVFIDRKEAKLTDLKVDGRVTLKLTADGKSVLAITEGWPDRNPPQRVEIQSIDTTGRTLTLPGVRGGADRVLPLGADVKVIVDGKTAKLDEIKPKTAAILKLSDDRTGTVLEITVTTPKPGERPSGRDERNPRRSDLVSGEIKALDTKAGTLTLPPGGRERDDRVLKLAKDVKVTVDGKEAKLEDVKVGTQATMKLADDRSSTIIEITIGRKETPRR